MNSRDIIAFISPNLVRVLKIIEYNGNGDEAPLGVPELPETGASRARFRVIPRAMLPAVPAGALRRGLVETEVAA